jgi:large subunit ribosomal protein L18
MARFTKTKGRVKSQGDRFRLSVFRSNLEIYAQIIDDIKGVTLAAASSLKLKKGNTSKAAEEVGKLIAEEAKKQNIKKVVFDRSCYKYIGRIKALADAARSAGLNF